jgi:hypothetical protein
VASGTGRRVALARRTLRALREADFEAVDESSIRIDPDCGQARP